MESIENNNAEDGCPPPQIELAKAILEQWVEYQRQQKMLADLEAELSVGGWNE